ncbi:MAG: tRNA (adenosine(37)-N6)-dimethylallyltransferase MiaA [Steroidobacterales bacterium]
MRPTAVLVMGPTGAGKSQLALRLVERFPLEIISVDSALVYRGMDIGTAKPDAPTRARILHHLIDIRDPSASYSAGEFVRDAAHIMQDIWARGRHPLLVGGTMLYFHALTAGIGELPEADAGVRAAIDAQAASDGWASLHAELARVDPPAAARIHLNDPQRIQRALEVFRLTGETITRLQQVRRPAIGAADVIELALAPAQRSLLHARIGARFEAMMAAGFLDEVRTFFDRGDLTREHPSMRAVGYRQLWDHLAGASSLEQATEKAVIATRQLAKRQLTWLRQRPQALWFDTTQAQCEQAVLEALSGGAFAGHASV